jgi:IMP dehydrogenase
MLCPEKEEFFNYMDSQYLALTYADVRIRTASGHGAELPHTLDVTSRFSTHVELKVPFVSAAMDTVTESAMAIEIAKLGGLGVIHCAMTIDQQRKAVRDVKMEVNGLIERPITVQTDWTIQQVQNFRAEKGHEFTTFPVLDSEGNFVGLLAGKQFEYHSKDTVVGVAMTPREQVLTADADTTIHQAYDKMRLNERSILPLVNTSGTLAGLYVFSDVKRIQEDKGHYNTDQDNQLYSAAAVSTISPTSDTMERVNEIEKYLDVVVIDTADGDSWYAFQTLSEIKAAFPDLDVVVGNVSEGESARQLAIAGADGIKVGQGPGSICSTRREIGIGRPQVTAVHDAIRDLGKNYSHIPVSADGGIVEHGDIPVAFAAGAHSVMMGNRFAGTKESPGPVFTDADGRRYKIYRGMGSPEALGANQASRERYQAEGEVFLPEGVSGRVDYKGPLSEEFTLCLLALRKSMRYVKTPSLTDFRVNSRLMQITNNGLIESHPHDVSSV